MFRFIISVLLCCVFVCSAQAQSFTIEEFIYDGVDAVPDYPNQGMDMHSFYDGEFIWYPSVDYTSRAPDVIENNILKYNPETGVLEKFELDGTHATIRQAYHAIQGQVFDTIWVYSAYGSPDARGLWKYTKSLRTSAAFIDLGAEATGQFGGKIVSLMVDGEECIVSTIIDSGHPVAYRVSDGRVTKLEELGMPATYGIQTDGLGNIFIAGTSTLGAPTLMTFTLDAAHTATDQGSIVTTDALDIAFDGTYIFTASKTASTALIETFEPTYTGTLADGFTAIDTHYTGAPETVLPASIKANSKYVAAAWESDSRVSLGWSILNRSTGVWTDFWNDTTEAAQPSSVYPFTGQYYPTVTIEIDYPYAIFITGYDCGTDNRLGRDACPDSSMRMLKLVPILAGTTLSNGTLSNATLH